MLEDSDSIALNEGHMLVRKIKKCMLSSSNTC